MANPLNLPSIIIQKGDTLALIAGYTGATVNALMAANPQIRNPNLITVGQTLYLVGDSAANFARIRNMVLEQKQNLPNTQGNWGSWPSPVPQTPPLDITITGGVAGKNTNIWLLAGGALILVALLSKKKR
jgi:LysM repeat protein